MARVRIAAEVGIGAVEIIRSLDVPGRAVAPATTLAGAVRYSLQVLADGAPGGSVEVRVPPFGVVQCIEGPNHGRGTPPNVVEVDPQTWMALVFGEITWTQALGDHRVHASGIRADLSGLLPLTFRNPERMGA